MRDSDGIYACVFVMRWSLESEVCLSEIQTGHWSNEESRTEGFICTFGRPNLKFVLQFALGIFYDRVFLFYVITLLKSCFQYR